MVNEANKLSAGLVVYLLAALICAVIAWTHPEWDIKVRAAFILAAVIFAIGGAMVGIKFLTDLADTHGYRNALNKAITPESELMRIYANLRPDQTEAWLLRHAALEAVPGVAGALVYYNVDGARVPMDFVQAWMERCSDEQLPALRQYSDKSNERKWAYALTKFFVDRGLAAEHLPGSGKAATWRIPRYEAAGWFSLLMES